MPNLGPPIYAYQCEAGPGLTTAHPFPSHPILFGLLDSAQMVWYAALDSHIPGMESPWAQWSAVDCWHWLGWGLRPWGSLQIPEGRPALHSRFPKATPGNVSRRPDAGWQEGCQSGGYHKARVHLRLRGPQDKGRGIQGGHWKHSLLWVLEDRQILSCE